LTRAPVIWSHSSARHFNPISRNVPDNVLKKIGTGKEKVDGVVMVNFYPAFVLPAGEIANTSTIADHVEWIAGVTGREQ
jgi:membrane dipeptidase